MYRSVVYTDGIDMESFNVVFKYVKKMSNLCNTICFVGKKTLTLQLKIELFLFKTV